MEVLYMLKKLWKSVVCVGLAGLMMGVVMFVPTIIEQSDCMNIVYANNLNDKNNRED
jgi:hypothetical protein